MNVQHILKDLVDDHESSVDQIAYDVCINVNTFKNKVNPNCNTHHVYIEDIDSIVKALDTDAIAKYFAEQRGLICIPKPNFNKLSDEALLDLRLAADEKRGDYAKEIRLAMADGNVDFCESVKVQKKFNEMIAAEMGYQNKFHECMAENEYKKNIRAIK